MVIDGQYGVSNIATVITYLLVITMAVLSFFIAKRGGRWTPLLFLLNPLQTFRTIETIIDAVKQIYVALPEMIKEIADGVSLNEMKTLIGLIAEGLQNAQQS